MAASGLRVAEIVVRTNWVGRGYGRAALSKQNNGSRGRSPHQALKTRPFSLPENFYCLIVRQPLLVIEATNE
ncbi:MAG: hypothetical protein DME26_18300 [Verrucomicrobia bacterium]|nr:MAG: hypothetical protein DME26_18300 [Verrucomicrobiota bacterium]